MTMFSHQKRVTKTPNWLFVLQHPAPIGWHTVKLSDGTVTEAFCSSMYRWFLVDRISNGNKTQGALIRDLVGLRWLDGYI